MIDAESTDATADLARERGAAVVVRPWEGFVATRRFALTLVRTQWTFMLDADEALDAELAGALASADPDAAVDAFAVARRTYFCGRAMRYGAWGADAPVRLFRSARATLVASPAAGGAAELHESWRVPGRIERLPGLLLHYSYPSVAAYRAKFARYTALEAQGLHPTPASFARTVLTACARVPWLLLVRGGWRDGWQGLFVGVASACYPVVVTWKALRAK